VIERAQGFCEYCLAHQDYSVLSHHIDHIIAVRHGGPTSLLNLALACVECNLHKGTDFATLEGATGQIVWLYNPRQQLWREHFGLDGARIVGITPTGAATATLLQLNLPDRVLRRQTMINLGMYPPTHFMQG
jgi:hypothetical protein